MRGSLKFHEKHKQHVHARGVAAKKNKRKEERAAQAEANKRKKEARREHDREVRRSIYGGP